MSQAAQDGGARPALPVLPGGGRRRFHVMVKPVGARCNLDCTYCFYLHKQRLLPQAQGARMSDEVLEQHVRQYVEAQDAEAVVFSWQGGEPTLAGLEFFERAMALQARHSRPGLAIENDLQTNGVLLDERWARFLAAHRFRVGLSVDGPPALHDRHRRNVGGGATAERVLRAAALLRDHGVPFTAMCVVHRENARHPLEVYRFLTRELGAWRVQFTPCVERRDFQSIAPWHWPAPLLPPSGSPAARPGTPSSVVAYWSVDPHDWGAFLCAVWDDWLANDLGRVHVNLFETAVAQSLGHPAQTCTQGEICGKALALEQDGSLYACDHFAYPEFRLGSILDAHEAGLAFSRRQQAFGFAKRERLPGKCRACPHLRLCWGECPKNRFVRTAEGEAGLNYLCPGLERFYAHARPGLERIERLLAQPAAVAP